MNTEFSTAQNSNSPFFVSLNQRQVIFLRLAAYIRALLLIFLFTAASTASARTETLRIGLLRCFRGITQISVTSTTDFKIVDPSSPESSLTYTSGESITFKSDENGISVTLPDSTIKQFEDNLEVAPVSSEGIIKISSARKSGVQYRGILEIHKVKTSLSLINRVDLEDYLLSVVPSEMPSHFNPEALKAQAVAARTYALAVRGKHKEAGYELCDEVNCQAYIGVNQEKPATTQAVKDTAGMIMTCDGRPIYAQFCSDCGGQTRQGNQPYLKSVLDKPDDGDVEYCSQSKVHNWSVTYTAEKFEPLLSRTSLKRVCGLKSVSVKSLDGSGRVSELEISDGSGTRSVCALELRKIIGPDVLRSGIFTITTDEDGSFLFQGKGWGHGVGMCQQGANGMANPPHSNTYDKILKHYYTGIEIANLGDIKQ